MPIWCIEGLGEIQTEEVYIYIIHDCSRAKQTLCKYVCTTAAFVETSLTGMYVTFCMDSESI